MQMSLCLRPAIWQACITDGLQAHSDWHLIAIWQSGGGFIPMLLWYQSFCGQWAVRLRWCLVAQDVMWYTNVLQPSSSGDCMLVCRHVSGHCTCTLQGLHCSPLFQPMRLLLNLKIVTHCWIQCLLYTIPAICAAK